jgi:predicted dehydrogenase
MSIPIIFVGCGNFALQRLQVLIDGSQFTPVACVDIDIEKAQANLEFLQGNVPKGLTDRVYTTISEAKEKHDAEVCFIFTVAKTHSKLVIES